MVNSDAKNRYILTLSCGDAHGVVAAVSGFLFDHGGFIIESAQFGDPSTGKFFMRTEFEAGEPAADDEAITALFTPLAEKFGMDWQLHDCAKKPRVLIAVTKTHHCLGTILNRIESGSLPIEVPGIVSNHEDLRYIAERYDIPFYHLPVTPETKMEQETELIKLFDELDCDLMVLARYMQILSAGLSAKLKGRAINIHHSFLPGFKGANPYRQAYDRGVKIIGATAHYVTSDLDEGPIIEQEVSRVSHGHDPLALKHIGQDIESQVLLRAVKYHIEHRVILNGNKTIVF